jgi:hypothetical protein
MAMIFFRHSPLPRPLREYSEEQMTQMVRVLELYFNQLDSQTPLQAEFFRGRGDQLLIPHIAASDSTDQRTTDNTATAVKFNTLESSSGWTLNSPGSATAQYPGVYTIRYSIQFINTANAVHFATVWLKVNNTDVTNSASIFTVPARKSASPGEEGYLIGYSEATFTVNAGDEIELYWATDQADVVSPAADGVFLFHDAAQASPFPRPAIPSVIGSISFVSALP